MASASGLIRQLMPPTTPIGNVFMYYACLASRQTRCIRYHIKVLTEIFIHIRVHSIDEEFSLDSAYLSLIEQHVDQSVYRSASLRQTLLSYGYSFLVRGLAKYPLLRVSPTHR